MKRSGGTSPAAPLKFMDHIRELQWRLLIVAAVLILVASLSFAFKDIVIEAILAPVGDQKLIYLTPAGAFSFIMMVSIYIGLAAAAPVLVYQLYSFLRPLLNKKHRKFSVRILVCASLLLIAGVAFGYFYAVPGALKFLSEFADGFVISSLTADSYLDFMVKYTLGLGIAFQVPIILMIIHWIKPRTPKGLLKSERWVIVLSFIAAAIITPTPDPLNQTIVALPLIGVYQLGVIAILISLHREKRHAKKLAKAERRQQEIANKHTARPPVKEVIPPTPLPLPTPALPAVATAQVMPVAAHTKTPVPLIRRPIDGVIVPRRAAHQPMRTPQPREVPQVSAPSQVIHQATPGRTGVYLDGVSRVISI